MNPRQRITNGLLVFVLACFAGPMGCASEHGAENTGTGGQAATDAIDSRPSSGSGGAKGFNFGDTCEHPSGYDAHFWPEFNGAILSPNEAYCCLKSCPSGYNDHGGECLDIMGAFGDWDVSIPKCDGVYSLSTGKRLR